MIEALGISPEKILVRLDSGHDASDMIILLDKLGVNYLIKRNLRKKSQEDIIIESKKTATPLISSDYTTLKYRISKNNVKPANAPNSKTIAIFEVDDVIKDKNGYDPYSLLRVKDPNDPNFGKDGVEYEVQSWWTNLTRPEQQGVTDPHSDRYFVSTVIDLYKDHATSEQYHSELKTDMNMELLPSHFFSTNNAFLAVSVLSFNILRLIGDKCLQFEQFTQSSRKKTTLRMRIKSVINKFATISFQIIRHARNFRIRIADDHKYAYMFAHVCSLL